MAKIILGARPQSFRRTVSFPLLDGEQGSIEMVFKYRTRKEYGAFVDDWSKKREDESAAEVERVLKSHEAAVKAAKEAGTEPPKLELLTQQGLQAKVVETSAEYILQIAEGWNLDVDFCWENIHQLCDEIPTAGAAIADAYRHALTEARQGN
jgi:hypothetical protein